MRLRESQQSGYKKARRELGELELAAAVAHEVRRLLTPAKAYAELALSAGLLSCEGSQAVVAILRAAQGCDEVLEALVSSGVGSEQGGADVAETARRIENEQVHIEVSCGLMASISPTRLFIVLSNLVANGIRACGPAECVELSASPCSTRNTIEIRVSDRGAGMSPGQLKLATEPFVSFASGSGIGLAICRHLVEDAGGSMLITSMPGRGTCVTVELPMLDSVQLKLSA